MQAGHFFPRAGPPAPGWASADPWLVGGVLQAPGIPGLDENLEEGEVAPEEVLIELGLWIAAELAVGPA